MERKIARPADASDKPVEPWRAAAALPPPRSAANTRPVSECCGRGSAPSALRTNPLAPTADPASRFAPAGRVLRLDRPAPAHGLLADADTRLAHWYGNRGGIYGQPGARYEGTRRRSKANSQRTGHGAPPNRAGEAKRRGRP